MRFLAVFLIFAYPVMACADLDRAIKAYNSDDLATAETEAAQALEVDLTDEDRLFAREILLSSKYYAGKTYPALREDVAALDFEFSAYFGQSSIERLGLLFILSNLYFETGSFEAATMANVLIARIALKHMDETQDDLLWASRNLANIYDNKTSDTRSAIVFAALFEFYAIDLLGFDNPMAQEATAMSALALLRARQDRRAAQKFFRYSFESWQDFAARGPDKEDLATRLIQSMEALPIENYEVWMTEVQAIHDAYLERETLAGEIAELIEQGQLDFASPQYLEALEKMREYIGIAYPEDPLAASYLVMILKSHLDIGDYNSARPYLAELLNYPATYIAVLDLPIRQAAGAFALRGGVEDTLLEPLLQTALKLESLVSGEDPNLPFDLTFALAQIKERQGRLDEALEDYTKAIELAARDGVRPKLINRALNGAAIVSADLGDFQAARELARKMLENALRTGDDDAVSAAYTTLARATSNLGQTDMAMVYARQKLTFEENRTDPDPEGILLARINLAMNILASDEITPELTDMLPQIFAGGAYSGEATELRHGLMEAVAARLQISPDTIEDSEIFAATSAEGRADLVAFLAEAAAQQGDLETALHWMIYGHSLAIKPSSAFFRLKQLEGDLALVFEEKAQALEAFRTLTNLRSVSPAVNEFGALDHLPLHITAAARMSRNDKTQNGDNLRDEAFRLAQMMVATRAGQSLTAALLRDQSNEKLQDLLRQRTVIDNDLASLAASISQARYDGRSADSLRHRESALLADRKVLSSRISAITPELAEISGFAPSSVAEVAQALRDDELLVIYATSDIRLSDGSATSHLVAVSRDAVEIAVLPPRAKLRALADRLRCSAALTDPNCGPGGGGTRGQFSLTGTNKPTSPKFDTDLAHQAYQVFLGPVSNMLRGKKRIIVVPDAALATLPAHLMMSEPLSAGRPFREAQWLIREHSIEIAPTVASFLFLRNSRNLTPRTQTFLGVGDPLIGVQQSGPLVFPCRGQDTDNLTVAALTTQDLQRAVGAERVSLVAELSALPDTRCELSQIASRFDEATLLLHGNATESNIKSMSENGHLRAFSVLSFATHGLIAGEIGINDSGLVLTPPEVATARDDGLLTTSEIAALNLDAEFVILSACNTASGDSRSDESLSGMASAFFVAGAKSLMVSHWPVYSDAAVDLTTQMFHAQANSPNMSRAEAVRLAMLSILDNPVATARMQHPSYWGAFMVVGDGLGSVENQ